LLATVAAIAQSPTAALSIRLAWRPLIDSKRIAGITPKILRRALPAMVFKRCLILTGLAVAFSSASFAASTPEDITVSAQADQSPSSASQPAPLCKAVFKNGASSKGWIDFELYGDQRIFVPAKISGMDTKVWLTNGVATSNIDTGLAASIGIQPKTEGMAPGKVAVQIQLGDLTLRDVPATAIDFAPGVERKGLHLPTSFQLGDDLFNQVAVDIDFAHHRIAFLDPATVTKPKGTVEIPSAEGSRTVPVSVEGAAAAQFEVFLGDPAPLTVYQAYYQAHKLLESRPTSIRLGGGISGGSPQEPVATLSRARFAGIDFSRFREYSHRMPFGAATPSSSRATSDWRCSPVFGWL
jgi:hypothetical protein